MSRFLKVSSLALLICAALALFVMPLTNAATPAPLPSIAAASPPSPVTVNLQAAPSAGQAIPPPVGNYVGQAQSFLGLASLLALAVGAVFAHNAKVKAVTDKIQAESAHIQTHLAGVDPAVYDIINKFFTGAQGRQMGFQEGLGYLAAQHPDDPAWQLGATTVAALATHFGPTLAKIGAHK